MLAHKQRFESALFGSAPYIIDSNRLGGGKYPDSVLQSRSPRAVLAIPVRVRVWDEAEAAVKSYIAARSDPEERKWVQFTRGAGRA
jgi:hypothetical protein